MVLQTCHASKLERFLDSLSEGWMKAHCYFTAGTVAVSALSILIERTFCAVRNHPFIGIRSSKR